MISNYVRSLWHLIRLIAAYPIHRAIHKTGINCKYIDKNRALSFVVEQIQKFEIISSSNLLNCYKINVSCLQTTLRVQSLATPSTSLAWPYRVGKWWFNQWALSCHQHGVFQHRGCFFQHRWIIFRVDFFCSSVTVLWNIKTLPTTFWNISAKNDKKYIWDVHFILFILMESEWWVLLL